MGFGSVGRRKTRRSQSLVVNFWRIARTSEVRRAVRSDTGQSEKSISIPFQWDDEYNAKGFRTLDGSDQLSLFNELKRGKQNKMPVFDFLWARETVEHLAEHAVSQDDFERVVCHPASKGWSRSSGLPCAWGYTDDGRYLIVVYEELDVMTVLPVTAYEVPEPR